MLVGHWRIHPKEGPGDPHFRFPGVDGPRRHGSGTTLLYRHTCPLWVGDVSADRPTLLVRDQVS